MDNPTRKYLISKYDGLTSLTDLENLCISLGVFYWIGEGFLEIIDTGQQFRYESL